LGCQYGFPQRLPLFQGQQCCIDCFDRLLHLNRPAIAAGVFKPLGIMPARSCPGAVLEGQHDQLDIARSAFSHGDGLTFPKQQSLLAAFLNGLQKFWMSALPVKTARGEMPMEAAAASRLRPVAMALTKASHISLL
jgi:hypothetical protein